MVLSEEEITRLFRIRKTVFEMLKDRGYFVGDFEIDMTREQFKYKYGESMKREDIVINKAKRNDSSDQIYVFFPEEQKVGVKTMKTYTNLYRDVKSPNCPASFSYINKFCTQYFLQPPFNFKISSNVFLSQPT